MRRTTLLEERPPSYLALAQRTCPTALHHVESRLVARGFGRLVTLSGVEHTGRLLISCPDRPGIVAAISRFLYERGANVTSSDQHSTDPAGGVFFMRVEFFHEELAKLRAPLEREFAGEVGAPFDMSWSFAYADEPKRVVVLCSRYEHCVLDVLWRWRSGELPCEIQLVVSNHPDLSTEVERFGVPYRHIPVTPGTKREAERLLADAVRGADLLVLARYMQILSGDFLHEIAVPVINIHHSFLPAFVGADPYRRASERGVKIIGATAHYVTEALDAGPIIEQDVAHVSHRDDVATLERIGRDVERLVLSRALSAHLEDRILVHDNRTVVFAR